MIPVSHPSRAGNPRQQPAISIPERCYAIVMRRDDREVLLFRHHEQLDLPTVEIPRNQRVAPNLLPAIEKRLGLSVIARFTLAAADLELGARCVVLEAIEDRNCGDKVLWTDVERIPWKAIGSAPVRIMLRGALEQMRQYSSRTVPARFVQPGWLAEVRNWVSDSLVPNGLRLQEMRSQYNMGPDYCLLQFATNQHDVWFKAVGPGSRREFTISRLLAEFQLPCVAPLLAVHEGWNAWLSLESHGIELDGNAGVDAWNSAARGLARLQIASIARSERLLAAGCRDLRTPALEASIEPFLSQLAGLMEQQTATTARRLTLTDLLIIEKRLRVACRDLNTMGLPDTLGHSDLNPGNVLVDGEQPIFLDWMEGHIGHPFLSLEYLLALNRRIAGGRGNGIEALRSAYCRCWTYLFPDGEMDRSLKPVESLAPFAYALTCHDLRSGDREVRPELAALLRSLGRRMLAAAESSEKTLVPTLSGKAPSSI
jgi:hypothetical protein